MHRHALLGIIFVIIICFSACSKQKTQDNSVKEETTTEQERIIPQNSLDDTELRADISNILNENITEVRILSWGITYRTTNSEDIEEIKNRLSQMELTETESKNIIDDNNLPAGGQILTLYLLQDDKILYTFHTDNRYGIFTVCGKPYETGEIGFQHILSYCRQKFFDGP